MLRDKHARRAIWAERAKTRPDQQPCWRRAHPYTAAAEIRDRADIRDGRAAASDEEKKRHKKCESLGATLSSKQRARSKPLPLEQTELGEPLAEKSQT